MRPIEEKMIEFGEMLEKLKKERKDAFMVIELDSMKVAIIEHNSFMSELLGKVFNPEKMDIGPIEEVKARFNATEVRPENFEGFAEYECVKMDVGKKVQALQMNFPEGCYYDNGGEIITGERGDWIVMYKGKFWKIVTDHAFRELFKPSKGGAQ